MTEVPLDYHLSPVVLRNESLIRDTLEIITSSGGIDKSTLLNLLKRKHDEGMILRALKRLLERGVIYEPEEEKYMVASHLRAGQDLVR